MRVLKSAAKLAAVVALLSSVAPVWAAPTLEEAFRDPPKEARPRVRWWWPGGAVKDEELARELDIMDKAGFGGAEIQAFNTGINDLTPEEKATVNQYATPPFFAHVRAAGEAAAARGLTLDYTFGSAWPSGGGFAIPPEKALTELTMARTEVQGGKVMGQGGPIKVTIPARTKRLGAMSSLDSRVRDPRAAGWIERFAARQRLVAVIAMKGTAPTLQESAKTSGFQLFPWSDVKVPGVLDPATAINLTDRLKDDGTLDWTPPPGIWQVLVFKQYASNMGVGGAAGEGPQLTLDHMDSTAFAAHAARVADPLGNRPVGVRAMFVDSLELMQDIAWTQDFIKAFKQRRGYDLTPYLPFVLQPGWMQAWGEHWSPPYFEAKDQDTAERVRTDFRQTVSDMMFAGFIEPFVAWNHARGLKAKFQAHGGAIDVIRGYGIVDIPETEDLVDNGDPFTMRLARSGADLYGRQIVSAESMVWKDRPYNVTPQEILRRADLIFASGVNSLNLHGFNYVRGATWPGWHAFQPSGFSLGFSTMIDPANPIWPAVPLLARYMGRTQALLQMGHPIVPVAYFYGRTGYYGGIEDQGAHKSAAEKGFMAAGYDYDRINPDSVAAARVEGRELVSRGGHHYKALVLPPLAAMRAETAESIARFAKAGLPVFFQDRVPDRSEGLAQAARNDARVRKAVRAALAAGAKVIPGADVPSALLEAKVQANLRFTSADPSGLVFVQREIDDRTLIFIHNTASETRDAGMVLTGAGGVARWNAMNGEVSPMVARASGQGNQIVLSLAPGESALLVQDPAAEQAPDLGAKSTIARQALSEGWQLSVKGHAPRRTELTRDVGEVALGDWRGIAGLESFAGVGTYRRQMNVPAGWLAKGQRVVMDLGTVHDMATVTVNGQPLPPAVSGPFRIDITSAVRAGSNTVEVAVATTPQNAMIDPKAAGFKNLQSVPTGLIGPVVLEVRTELPDRTPRVGHDRKG